MSAEVEKKQCAHVINGPKMGKNVVAWRKQCKRMVKGGGYCWQHRDEHYASKRRASWPYRTEVPS